MSKIIQSNVFYIPLCGENNCNGLLRIKKINENFSLNFECEKSSQHNRKNIIFKAFERFYLKEKKIEKCKKCDSNNISCKCKICKNIYCSSCSINDKHIKENSENSINMDSQKCLTHNSGKNHYCLDCKEYLCETCVENEHEEHNVENLSYAVPSSNKIDEMKKRISHYDTLLNSIIESSKSLLEIYLQKIENLKQNIIDEKNLIEKLVINFNKKYFNYYYFLNFETLFEYTKSFNNDKIEEFYLEDSIKNKNKILVEYLNSKDKIKDIEIPKINCYLQKIRENKE